ncbi:hypothetical protein MKX08_004065 [Trichoderma sp. CBMAI-0020]|nr:hypothetical protein MKX08_004065 [Trichoderma sp. CBMAI-0020]
MTARISPTERPGQRIGSGADHAKEQRDTARPGSKTLNGTADSAPFNNQRSQQTDGRATGDGTAENSVLCDRRRGGGGKKLQQSSLEAEDGSRSLGRGP